VRTAVSAFLDGLFRRGAFAGARPEHAYFVRCGLGDTMTSGDLAAGRLVVLAGFAPLRPAEFVVLRIEQAMTLVGDVPHRQTRRWPRRPPGTRGGALDRP
jgi:uncharacterized protein